MRILPKSLLSISQKNSYRLQQGVIWGAPSFLVPALRLTQDPKETRWQLFARDLSTFGVGIIANFSTGLLTARLLQRKIPNPSLRQLLSVAAGVVSYIAFAVLGAPRLAKTVHQKLQHPKSVLHPPALSSQAFKQPSFTPQSPPVFKIQRLPHNTYAPPSAKFIGYPTQTGYNPAFLIKPRTGNLYR